MNPYYPAVRKNIFILLIILFSSLYSNAQTGEALHFNGSNNSVLLPFGLNGSYTKEAWIRPGIVSGFPNIISGNNTALFIANGQLTAGHAGAFAFSEVKDPAFLTANTWYHVAVTYNAATSEMKLYKDGIEVASNPSASPYTEGVLYLSLFGGGNYFTGDIDEVRIWNTARSSTEINQSKNCELSGDEPGLFAYYNFNQGVAAGNNTAITTLTDTQDKCSPFNGTLNNFTLTGTVSNFIAPGSPVSGSCTATFPNINITGNGLCIALGDMTPVATDFTYFGNHSGVPVVRTYVIHNTGTATLNISSINISGTNAADFSVSASPPSAIAAGASANFSVSFHPSGALGTKTATVTVNTNDADEAVYPFAVEGIKSDAGKSLDFDGLNDDVTVPFVFTGDYTKEAWIKTNTTSGFPNIFSGTGTAMFLNNGKLAAGHAPSFNQAVDVTTLATNQWYHVAVSYNATTQEMKLYLNGTLVITSAAVPAYTETDLKIGSFNGANFFWGRIDQVRAWNVVRTDAEILNSASCNISGDEPGLLAWYNFNQGAGEGDNTGLITIPNDVDDCNAAANNATLNNFALTGTISNYVSESNNILSNCAATFPNIRVNGNGLCIVSGDASPLVADNTDFGTISGATNKTFVIHNTGTATLNIGTINFTGTDNAMFAITTAPPASIAPGASANMVVTFTPVGSGIKTATITINNDDADEAAYTFNLQANVQAGAINISNIVASTNVNGTANISWDTDVAANSIVDYGTAPAALNLNNNDPAFVTSHSIQLTGLTLGTTYYFRVTSTDASSNTITVPTPPDAPLSFSMPPLITTHPATQTICEAGQVTFTSAATSDVPSTVQWQISTDNGTSWLDSTGATNASISFTVSDADNGKQFRAVWTNAGGANNSDAAILTVSDTTWGVENIAVCNNLLPFSWNGNQYTASGTYNITLAGANANGCDSVAVLNLTVKDTSFSVTNVAVCNNLLPYNWNGVDYNASGSYTIVLPAANVNGCDSTATLNLVVKDTSFSVTNISICNNLLPYNWNGVDYNASGSYTIVLPAANVNGCDSTATLNLTVKDTSFSVTNVSICNNLLPYNWNGVDYNASGSYTIVLPAANVNGCDSTATLNLIVKDTSFSVTNVSICNNLLPYNWNGVDYNASGSYTIVLPAANVNGCDSTATLNLIVKDTSFSVTNVSICNNLLPYNWNGVDYNASGSYTIVLPAANVNGCDSTATLNLIVKDTSFSITNVSICNNLLPYNWNGVDYNTPGSYTIVLPAANVNGCDSTATLNLTITSITGNISKQYLSCIGESDGSITVAAIGTATPYEYSIDNGTTWNTTGIFNNLAAGNYTIRIKDVNGCYNDTIVNMDIDKVYWTGSVNNDWHTAGNWSSSTVPGSNTHVIIPAGTVDCIISSADAQAASLQVLTGANARIENNREIIVSGQCTTLPAN